MKFESIIKDYFLTFATFGLYNFYVQFRQIEDTNEILGERKYSFFKVIVLAIFTFGLYFCYHEYKLTKELRNKVYGHQDHAVALIVIPLAFIGIWPAIDSYQQVLLNAYVNKRSGISGEDLKRLLLIGILYLSTVVVLMWYLIGKGLTSGPLEYFLR